MRRAPAAEQGRAADRTELPDTRYAGHDRVTSGRVSSPRAVCLPCTRPEGRPTVSPPVAITSLLIKNAAIDVGDASGMDRTEAEE